MKANRNNEIMTKQMMVPRMPMHRMVPRLPKKSFFSIPRPQWKMTGGSKYLCQTSSRKSSHCQHVTGG